MAILHRDQPGVRRVVVWSSSMTSVVLEVASAIGLLERLIVENAWLVVRNEKWIVEFWGWWLVRCGLQNSWDVIKKQMFWSRLRYSWSILFFPPHMARSFLPQQRSRFHRYFILQDATGLWAAGRFTPLTVSFQYHFLIFNTNDLLST